MECLGTGASTTAGIPIKSEFAKFMGHVTCHYNLRKYSFCSRVINIWNSLPDHVRGGGWFYK